MSGDSNRRVIPTTCIKHGGTHGFVNLVVRKLDGEIELDPHGLRCCVLVLDEAVVTQLFDTLGEWLGWAPPRRTSHSPSLTYWWPPMR